jgi:hypothetical protein
MAQPKWSDRLKHFAELTTPARLPSSARREYKETSMLELDCTMGRSGLEEYDQKIKETRQRTRALIR